MYFPSWNLSTVNISIILLYDKYTKRKIYFPLNVVTSTITNKILNPLQLLLMAEKKKGGLKYHSTSAIQL